MYLSNYGQRPDVNEASHRLKLQAKLEAEYGLVKDMGAPGAKPGAAGRPPRPRRRRRSGCCRT